MTNTQYDEILREDADAIQKYIEEFYSLKVPPPQKPTNKDLSFWAIVGLEATLYTIAALAGAIVSAVRTGGLFYILEKMLLAKFNLTGIISDVLGVTVLISSLAAFEGYLIAYGFSKGRELTSAKTSKAGMFASILVIMAAGVFSGTGIIQVSPIIEQNFYLALALITAIGAALVTLFGGENIGYAVEKYILKRKELLEIYQEEFNRWNLKAVSSYSSSHYSKIRNPRKESPAIEQTLPKKKENKGQPFVDSNKRTGNNRSIIYRLLNELYKQTGVIPKVTETTNELALRLNEKGLLRGKTVEKFVQDKKGYVSLVRKEWMQENNILE